MDDYLVLVDEKDVQCGKFEKLQVHQLGLLHRAFSAFVFNSKGELLLQQRADDKYHSGGLWSNTCCSHPRHGEETSWAVKQRLKEEMGMSCNMEFKFSFIYNAIFENGLTEYEFDHVYFGISDDLPSPKELEVKDWKYLNLEDLENEIWLQPENYTEWLKICLPQVKKMFSQSFYK